MSKAAAAAQHERRTYNCGTVEVRAKTDSTPAKIAGYAALFGVRSLPLGYYGDWVEVIEKEAFDDVLEDDVRCLLNHDPNHVLARTKSGTLKLSVDDKGLYYEAELSDTETARSVASAIERGDISQSSFAFDIAEGGANWVYFEKPADDIYAVRTITKVGRLYDVSPVTFPAYEETEVSRRSREEARPAANNDWEATAALRLQLRAKHIL